MLTLLAAYVEIPVPIIAKTIKNTGIILFIFAFTAFPPSYLLEIFISLYFAYTSNHWNHLSFHLILSFIFLTSLDQFFQMLRPLHFVLKKRNALSHTSFSRINRNIFNEFY